MEIKGQKFQNAYDQLGETAKALHNISEHSSEEAKKAYEKAKAHGNVVEAGISGVESALWALGGTASEMEAALRFVGATATGAAGAGAVVVEDLGSAARWAFQKMAQGLLSLSNAIGHIFGYKDRHEMVTSVLGDPNAKRLSERLFDSAEGQFRLSGEAAKFGWECYTEMAHALADVGGHACGALYNVGAAAVHTGYMLGNLGLAAAYAGFPAVVALAELGVRAAQIAVEYADKGVDGSRAAMVLSAEILTAAGNALAHPDQDQKKIIEKQIGGFEKRLAEIQKAA